MAATRLYLQNSAIPYDPATNRGAWDATGTPFKGWLATIPGGAATTTTKAETVATNNYDILIGKFVSSPLSANHTFGGTVEWMVRASEANADANAFFHVHIYVTQGDSDTPRGTLLTDSIGATEFTTTAAGRGEGTKSLTGVAAQAGDRIVVEIGARLQNTHTTSRNIILGWGGEDNTDLTSTNTTAGRPKWVEFSDHVPIMEAPTTSDDFNDNSLDSGLWGDWGGANTNETNNRFEITGSTTPGEYFGMDTVEHADFTGAHMQVQLVDPGTNNANRVVGFGLSRWIDNSIYWEYNNGTMRCYKAVQGTYTQVGTDLTYPGNNYYWRIEEQSGTTSWQYSTSATGPWTTHASESNPIPVNDLYGYLLLGTDGAVGAASFAYYDNYSSGVNTILLTVADARNTHAVDNVVLTQKHTLAVADARNTHAVDNVVLTQKHTLTVADATHSHAADSPTLVQDYQAVVQDARNTHAAESPTLTQKHTLAVQDALHGHTTDAIALTQKQTLVVADAAHAHSAESPTLSTAAALAIQDARNTHTAESPTLTQKHTLAVQDALHAHAAESPALTQKHTLVVADTRHTQAVDSPTLTQKHSLAVADARNTHTADNVALTQKHTLVVQDSTHAHTIDSPALLQNYHLVVADARHTHTADDVALSSESMLGVLDAHHGHTVDNVAIAQKHLLAVQDARHTHSAESPTLDISSTLIVADAHHGHTADNVTLVLPFTVLVVQDARHLHAADNVVLRALWYRRDGSQPYAQSSPSWYTQNRTNWRA